MKYRIDLTRNQIWAIQKACEFYSRFLAGQWEIPDAMEVKEFINQDRYPEFWTKRNYIEEQMKVLSQMLTGLPIHASYGIGSDKMANDANICYDVYRPILELFNKDSNNVYSHPGLTYSKDGRIKIEVINE